MFAYNTTLSSSWKVYELPSTETVHDTATSASKHRAVRLIMPMPGAAEMFKDEAKPMLGHMPDPAAAAEVGRTLQEDTLQDELRYNVTVYNCLCQPQMVVWTAEVTSW